MNYRWTLPCTLTTFLAIAMATPSQAQYQGYSSSPQYGTYAPPRAQLPEWNSPSSAPSQTATPQMSSYDRAPAPHAYSPSEMPSVNPFANVRSQQPSPTNYGNAAYQPQQQYQPAPQYQSTPQYQPAARQYNTYSVSNGDPQPHAIGGGMNYANPTQQVAPTPLPNSYYDQPVQSYAPTYDAGCDPKGVAYSTGIGVRSGWYAGVGGVIMNRDLGNNLWLSVDQTDIRDRVLNSNDADYSYAGGVAATIGHYFNCGQNSIQFAYWGIYPSTAEANAYGADTAVGIDTILHFDGLQYDAGLGGGAQDLSGIFFFDAERHRVQREYSVYNIELNLLGHNFTNGCSPWQLSWLAGVRYLRFDDNFLFSSDRIDTAFTGDAREVHYAIDVENNLVGFQIGGRAGYCVGPRLSLFADTKVGIYGNHISHRSRIYGANGQAFVGDAASPYFGQDVDFTTSRDSFSMIGDLSVGANWCISPCWSINAGYRAVGVSGVALSTSQVPVDFIGALDSLQTVNSSGCLILHGAFAGINFCY
ncbi:MAG: BBP7 family outer membrane beta-barrel protein [Planctomycetaceae bacterium]|nr:BBP7 family outer membrane beta-barrel protein [Planctomycetaceae bacterium]